MQMIIYFIAVLILGILSAYTVRFQEATHHWGRILAGQQSLEAELSELEYYDIDLKTKKHKEGYLRGYASTQRGYQDAITPRIQNLRNVIHLISIPAIPIAGFIFFSWYVPLLGLFLFFLLWSNIGSILPRVNSSFFKKRIISGLNFRRKLFGYLKNDLKVEAAEHFIDELENSKSDISEA